MASSPSLLDIENSFDSVRAFNLRSEQKFPRRTARPPLRACTSVFHRPFGGDESKLAEQQQDQDDDQNRANDSRRTVAPAGAVTPIRDDAEQQQDENNEQNGTERHDAFLAKSLNRESSRSSTSQVREKS